MWNDPRSDVVVLHRRPVHRHRTGRARDRATVSRPRPRRARTIRSPLPTTPRVSCRTGAWQCDPARRPGGANGGSRDRLNGNRRHSCTSSTSAAKRLVGGRGSAPSELVDEQRVPLGKDVEIPGAAEDLGIGHERAGLGEQHDGVVAEIEIVQDRVRRPLALGVRRDGDARPDEAEAGESEPAAELMSLRPLILGHRRQHDQPPRIPRRRRSHRSRRCDLCRPSGVGFRTRSGASACAARDARCRAGPPR